MTKDFLVDLCKSPFVSGFEHTNGNILKEHFGQYTDSFEVSGIGSYIFGSKGTNNTKIMLAAHMDEIGLMITDICDGGFLAFTSVGGINAASLVAQDVTVYGNEHIFGVIGIKPPHITPVEERGKAVKISDLYIDTGYTKEKLETIVKIGDVAVIKREPTDLQGSVLTARALDDKAGIAVMYETAKELSKISHKSNVYYAATVQEETSMGGAKTAAYKINPDMCIVLDVGFGFTPELAPEKSLVLGKGAGVCIGSRLNPMLTRKYVEVCKKYNYAFQYDVAPGSSGTDADAIQTVKDGIPCILLSIPLRYMHTSVETVDVKDIESIGRSIARFINEIDNSDLEEILCF